MTDREFWREIRRALLLALKVIEQRYGFNERETPAGK